MDTNIILDTLASRKPFAGDAEKIFLLAVREEVEAYISASSITDIYYNIEKIFLRRQFKAEYFSPLSNLQSVVCLRGRVYRRA